VTGDRHDAPEGAAGRPPSLGLRAARLAIRARSDVTLVLIDALVTAGAYAAMLVLRFDGAVPPEFWDRFPLFVVLAVAIHLAGNWMLGLYRRIWRHAGVQEARGVLLAGGLATALLLGSQLLGPQTMPLSVVALGGSAATVLVGFLRFQSRLFAFQRSGRDQSGLRVAVLGAGDSAAIVVREMQRNRADGLSPVVILDDDPHKRDRSLLGVPVVGSIDELPEMAQRFELHQALLAVASADTALVRRAADAAEAANLPLKVLPGVKDLIRGRVSVRDARELRIEDLLGRQQVSTDLRSVRDLLAGRRVLVTGGGGSIGAEIARQVVACDPAAVVLLDHDETHLHDVASGLEGPVVQVLADIRNARRVGELFDGHRPEVVFHAAAHKHVPLLEDHPREAIENNVFGTVNVVQAARRAGVDRLVFISTDKAVRPASVMGASKRIGEQVVLTMSPPGARYTVVRFGNVLGSRGSVIPTFARQIAAGGPVTVTDPRMTRFFMSIEEAVQLVLQAAALADAGGVYMLEMGESVDILRLAHRMIRLSGYEVGTEIPIRITGVRPGEKLVEELCNPEERVQPTAHASIVRVLPPPLTREGVDARLRRLDEMLALGREPEAAAALLRLAGEPDVADLSAAGDMLDLAAIERSGPWSRSTT
jgi:FlaA1/EpsC-like NDP-sugar epimerase